MIAHAKAQKYKVMGASSLKDYLKSRSTGPENLHNISPNESSSDAGSSTLSEQTPTTPLP